MERDLKIKILFAVSYREILARIPKTNIFSYAYGRWRDSNTHPEISSFITKMRIQ